MILRWLTYTETYALIWVIQKHTVLMWIHGYLYIQKHTVLMWIYGYLYIQNIQY